VSRSVVKWLRVFLWASLLAVASGCGVVSFRLPEQFRDKKLLEDPPPTSSLPEGKLSSRLS
jgi:hypothetical protein